MRSKLFGKIFFSLLLVIIVWMVVFYLTTQIVLVRIFARQYDLFVQNPPPAMAEEFPLDSNDGSTEPEGSGQGEGGGLGQGLGQGANPGIRAFLSGRLREEIRRLFRTAVNTSMRWAILSALIVAIIASLLIARSLVKPAQQMSVAAQRIADGHYSERVALPDDLELSQYDEWQDFAHQFNLMAESLEATEQMRLQLLGDVTHEMRTPLTTIKGYMEALMDGVMGPDPATFNRIYIEADRLQHLVADLQELSRAEANAIPLEYQDISPQELLEATMQRLHLQYADKGVNLETTVAEGLPLIHVDRQRLEQVLTNLTGNALNYTPQGGTVKLNVSADKEKVIFTVADNGIGIAEEHLKHIFDRFYRVDKSRARKSGGSGIGLTIAKSLVEMHGGTISATSPGEGKGSTFQFTIPIG
ncbi:MAG: HAMP domain-containing sensor histidine kinase [Anaerolineae bacterium]|jgi:histidine kinase|nr:HAMP domain-containing sensor histidine kinase [Anaerolineae bacterium]